MNFWKGTTMLIEIIPPHLNAVKANIDYFILDCPNCGRSQKAFLYLNTGVIKCNRRNNCGYKSHISRLPGVNKSLLKGIEFPESYDLKKKSKKVVKNKKEKPLKKSLPKKENDNGFPFEKRDKLLRKAFTGKDRINYFRGRYVPGSASSYLAKRLPGCNITNLFRRKYIASSAYIGSDYVGSEAQFWAGYTLFTPLYDLKTGLMISGQTRFTKNSAPIPDRYRLEEDPDTGDIKYGRFVLDGEQGQVPYSYENGSQVKNMTLSKCKYSKSGVSFVSLDDAISKARRLVKSGRHKYEVLYLTEGDIDTISLLALGYRNTIGVPGAAQAFKVVKELIRREWRGVIVACLDGDEAGEKAYHRMVKEAKDSGIIIKDGRPFKGKDINDLLVEYGPRAVEKHLNISLTKINPLQIKKAVLASDDHDEYLKRHDMYMIGRELPQAAVDKLIASIKLAGGKDSNISKLSRPLMCRRIIETIASYDEDYRCAFHTTKKKVAESTFCAHCAASQWNMYISKFLREKWAENLSYIMIPFDSQSLKDFKAVRSGIFKRCSAHWHQIKTEALDEDLFIIADFTKSCWIAVTTQTNKNGFVHSGLRIYGTVIDIKREELLAKFIGPAYMSRSEYFRNAVMTDGYSLTTDDFLTKKYESYKNRKGLPWPSTKNIREGVREEAQRRREIVLKEMSKINDIANLTDDEQEGPKAVFSYIKKDGKVTDILSITPKSVSVKNLVNKAVFGEKIKFNPQDPLGFNILDPKHEDKYFKAGKEFIDDLSWILYKMPYLESQKQGLFTADLTFPETDPRERLPGETFDEACTRIKKYMKNLSTPDYHKELARWNEHGYTTPREFGFLPLSVPFAYFLRISRQIREEKMMRQLKSGEPAKIELPETNSDYSDIYDKYDLNHVDELVFDKVAFAESILENNREPIGTSPPS